MFIYYPFLSLLTWRRKVLWVMALISTVCLFSCRQQTVQLPPLPEADDSASHDYLLVPEDVVEIIVWKNPDLSRSVTIRPDGKISLPLIGDVQAAGRTPRELKDDIAENLKTYYQEPPQVAVIVEEVKGYEIYILGGVENPGKHVVKNGTTFLQAVALAGGFTDFASTKHIQLRRRMNGGEEHATSIQYDEVILGKQKNLVLKAGDIIIVPQ